MHKRLLLAAALLASTPLAAADDPSADVSQERLTADIQRLVSFGTRHTLSAQDDPKRGIGAARGFADYAGGSWK